MANSDRARALSNRLGAGHLHFNDQTETANPVAPFGGHGRSGSSISSGTSIWKEFTQWVWVSTKTEATSYSF